MAVAIGVPLVFAAIVAIILFAGRARPVPGLGPHAPAHQEPPTGDWNAQLLPMGGFAGFGSTYGTVRIGLGTVTFTPDGATAPAWSVPCQQVAVRKHGLLSLDGADLELAGPMGRVRLVVSRERINRLSANDLKAMRERGYADEFIWTLQANGAGVYR